MSGRQSSKSNTKSNISPPRPHSPLGPIMCSSNIPSYTKPSSSPNISPNISPNTQTNTPSFFGTVKEGIALGVGSSIGNRIVSGIFGAPSVEIKSTQGNPFDQNQIKCSTEQLSFNTCIQDRKEVSECEEKLATLNKCLSKI